jgi:hypothetical protein
MLFRSKLQRLEEALGIFDRQRANLGQRTSADLYVTRFLAQTVAAAIRPETASPPSRCHRLGIPHNDRQAG